MSTPATAIAGPASAGSTAPALRVRDLGVSVTGAAGGRRLLDGLSFDVPRGGSVGVVGASGAGKSTLGLALMRLLPPTMRLAEGSRMLLGDRDLVTLDPESMRAVRGRHIAMVMQEPITALDPSMTIGEQLAEAVLVHGLATRREARERAIAMLDRVGISGGSAGAKRYPHELSGGMRQRLLLAMTLMLGPELLIADEPTTALDPLRQRQMLDLLDELRVASGTALLLISHDLEVVGERCDRVLVLDAGRLVERGVAPAAPVRPRAPSAASTAPRTASAPLLEVRELSVIHPERRRGFRTLAAVPAVDAISLAISEGEVLGVVGESGCGKTSLAHAILRLGPSRAAALRFDGADLASMDGETLRRTRRHLQFVSQDAGASLTAHLTVESLVSEGLVVHRLCGEDEARRRARALLDELALPASIATALPTRISSGQRQRVAIARALASGPKLLICDEPVSSVDPPTRAHLLDLLLDLRARHGLAMLFISHDIAAVARVADRILVMRDGREVESGPASEVLTQPSDAYTRSLLAAVPTGRPRRA